MVHPDEFDEEASVVDELYSGQRFNTTLESLGIEDYSLGLGGDLSEREFMMARVGKWGSPMYTDDAICCVYEVYDDDAIDVGRTGMKLSDVLDERPYRLTKNDDPVPSLRGQYLKVMECNIWTDDDGIDHVKPRTPSYWIPVEWVRQYVRYDEEDTELEV